MGYYWVDRILPGLIDSLIWTPVWAFALWRIHRAWSLHQDKIDEIKERLDNR